MKIIVALLIFGVIITFHELGHFLLAKKNGIVVTEFSLGMGPRLFSRVYHGTRYSLKLFPIGGSCMMLGEDELNDNEGAFNNKSVWARISTIFAGPLFNFILAFFLALFVVGMVGYDPARVVDVPEGSAGANAGLKVGDIITEIDGANVVFARDITSHFYFSPLKSQDPITVKFKRSGEIFTTTLVPEVDKRYMLGISYVPDSQGEAQITLLKNSAFKDAGIKNGDIITAVNGTGIKTSAELASYLERQPLDGSPLKITYTHNGKSNTVDVTPRMTENFFIGFSYNMENEKTGVLGVIRYSVAEVRYWIETTIKSLGQLITGKVGTDDIGGPVRIVSELGDVVEAREDLGIKNVILVLFNYCLLLSANLGVMNLLPIPALDGGRLIFLIIEAVRGKPLDREKEGFVHMLGFVALMILMVFLFFNDIKNVFF
nr:RIP metalloprotease RseP [uncultured Lachnoclostridium sp.]